jgi:hypothetical protein
LGSLIKCDEWCKFHESFYKGLFVELIEKQGLIWKIFQSRCHPIQHCLQKIEVFKKTEKPIKPRKLEKKQLKKPNREKNRLNQLKFLKNRPVRFGFGFLSLEPEKPNRTEKNWKTNRAKPSQN